MGSKLLHHLVNRKESSEPRPSRMTHTVRDLLSPKTDETSDDIGVTDLNTGWVRPPSLYDRVTQVKKDFLYGDKNVPIPGSLLQIKL